jgi:ribose/xylose/arabinose/galactoside ABC-type transport system permease subunit
MLGVTRGRPITRLPEDYLFLGTGDLWILPLPFVYMVVIAILCELFLTQTTLGRKMYGIGCNENAMELSGINVNITKYSAYILCGILSAFSGFILTARLSSAQPSSGQGWLLLSFGASALGGTSITGGMGNIKGAVLGTFIFSVLSNMMVLLRVSVYWQEVVIGLVIVGVVGLGVFQDTLFRGTKR